MPIYRARSGTGIVIFVFTAASDEDAERFVRQVKDASPAHTPPAGTGVHVDGLIDDNWYLICAWDPRPGRTASTVVRPRTIWD
jgi:hypothetical protein